MNSYPMTTVEKKDIMEAILSTEVEWEKFKGKTIAITGATGLLGKSIINILLEANKHYGLKAKVLAFVRDIKKAESVFGEHDTDILSFVKHDVMDQVPESISADYLIHAASITASKMMIEQPVETIMTTVDGTRNMMDFAVRCKMQGVVYLSSMEMYGTFDPDYGEVKENALGYIDLTNVRSGYPESKRLAECLCASYAQEYHVKVRVARLAQTFGAGISKTENRVFAQFARSILNGEDIVLHTKGDKANCYCYTTDAVTAILMLLTKGENGQAYNVANMDTFCSIREMAEIFLQYDKENRCRLRIEIPENIDSLGYAPSNILRLNSEKLTNLGWKPKCDIQGMICRLLESMKCCED